VPTADRVGIDIVATRHYTLLDAQFVDVSKRREQENELNLVADNPRFIDEPQKCPSCQCGFDAEGLPPLKKATASTEKSATSFNRNRIDVRWIDIACNIVGV
jgi:hypothetical protein